jgi:hypothetical protein
MGCVASKVSMLRNGSVRNVKWAIIGTYRGLAPGFRCFRSNSLQIYFCFGLANLKANKGSIYLMDDYLDGRKNEAAYFDFYSTVMMGVLGKVEFKHRVRTYPLGSEIGTISDEALGLLIADNYIDRWIDMFKNSKGNIRILTGGEEMPDEWKSQVPTKYTASANDGIRSRGGKAAADDQDDTFNRKWSAAGIVRFNELRRFAKQDRLNNPDFATKWMSAEKQTMKATRRSDNLFEEPDVVVEADNDLDSGDDDLIGDGKKLVKSKNDLGIDDSDPDTEEED